MKSISYFFLISIVGFVTACAKLQVTVDVMNSESIRIRNVIPDILAQDALQIKTIFLDFKAAHQAPYIKMAREKRMQAALLPPSETDKIAKLRAFASELDDGFDSLVSPKYKDMESDWLMVVSSIRTKFRDYDQQTDIEKKRYLQRSLSLEIDYLNALKRNIVNFRKDDLNEKVESKLFTEKVMSESAGKLAETNRQLFQSGGIEHSPFLFEIVSAPDGDWAKYYDKSFGEGYFGNTDIAIKALDGPGNFTVKGLSFNPSDVANAAAKVTTQTVVLAAQIAGVPVNLSGTPTGNGAALATASTRISTVMGSSEQVKVAVKNQREALVLLAQAILAEQENLTSDQQRAEALRAILAVYVSQKPRLTIVEP